ncbi:MAG: copper resistance CopC/CopD family protein [Pseudolabrys sp.]
MRRFAAGLAAVAVVLAVMLQASAALAHATLVKAEPADGAVVPTPPSVLRLAFNEPVSPLAIRLIDPSGRLVSLGDITAANAGIAIAVPALHNGTHVLSWRVVSADGHPVGGALVFSIGAPSAQPPSGAAIPADPVLQAALWVAKVAIYLGFAIGIGGAFFRAWIAPHGAARSAEPWIVTALIAGLAATPLSVGLQGLDALELSLREIGQRAAWETGLETAYGATAIVAAFALFAGVFSLAATSRRLSRVLSLIALVGVGVALSLSGHASNAEPRVISRPAVFLHAVCMTFWVGSLLPLWTALRGEGRDGETLARFSRAIPVPLTLLAASGLWLAYAQLGRVDALWTTDYGLVLLGKLVLVVLLLVMAAANRYRFVPRLRAEGAAAAPPLRRSIGTELALAVAILALVALWRFTPPPRSLAAVNTVSIHLHGARAMAQIEIVRDGEGRAAAQIQVLDGEFRPLAAREVTLILANPAAGIEPIRRAGVRSGNDDMWRVDDVRIPVAGRWDVGVDVLISDFEQATVQDAVMLPRVP